MKYLISIRKWFGWESPHERLKKLIATDRYKNSMYTIQQVNGEFALKDLRLKSKYVDLVSCSYSWDSSSSHYLDCFSSLGEVLDAFDYRCPVIVKVNIEKEY
jgi:hypothetical protein